MKKLLIALMAVLMVSGVAGLATAGDFEMSGHINTGLGWQYNSKSMPAALGGAFVQEGMMGPDFSVNAANELTNNSTWMFYVGEVELDIAKTFGENIRLRTDLDFKRPNSNSYTLVNNLIEQAYATINIPVGYGIEFLVGRFNAPMGFEAVDNNDNDLPFHSMIFNFLRPQNLTGIKFYYPFSDLVDLHVWFANNLRDIMSVGNGQMGAGLPAFGMRLGFSWGTEGQESTVGISGAGSSETQAAAHSKWGKWSYLGDIDFNIWANDVFAIGGEGIFRRDGAPKGLHSNYYLAGLLNLHYLFSDVWDGTLQYGYTLDRTGSPFGIVGSPALFPGAASLNGELGTSQFHVYGLNSATGWKAQYHQVSLGINYHITDGAKIMAMYRLDYILPATMGLAKSYANENKYGLANTVAANFAYEF